MKRAGRRPIWNWVIHTPWVLAVIALLAVIVFFGSGAGQSVIERAASEPFGEGDGWQG